MWRGGVGVVAAVAGLPRREERARPRRFLLGAGGAVAPPPTAQLADAPISSDSAPCTPRGARAPPPPPRRRCPPPPPPRRRRRRRCRRCPPPPPSGAAAVPPAPRGQECDGPRACCTKRFAATARVDPSPRPRPAPGVSVAGAAGRRARAPAPVASSLSSYRRRPRCCPPRRCRRRRVAVVVVAVGGGSGGVEAPTPAPAAPRATAHAWRTQPPRRPPCRKCRCDDSDAAAAAQP